MPFLPTLLWEIVLPRIDRLESSLDWTRQSFSSIRSIDDNGRHTTTTTSLVISFIRGHFSKEEKNDGRSQRSYLLTRISDIYIYISRTSLCVLRRRSIAVRQLDRDQTREGERVSFRSRYLSYPPMQSYRSFSIFSAIRIIDETIRAVKKKILVATRERRRSVRAVAQTCNSFIIFKKKRTTLYRLLYRWLLPWRKDRRFA